MKSHILERLISKSLLLMQMGWRLSMAGGSACVGSITMPSSPKDKGKRHHVGRWKRMERYSLKGSSLEAKKQLLDEVFQRQNAGGISSEEGKKKAEEEKKKANEESTKADEEEKNKVEEKKKVLKEKPIGTTSEALKFDMVGKSLKVKAHAWVDSEIEKGC
ncbi:hypothetical protein L1987_64819 [Smallanthus sonchifolius]|uniref:Uncharacterized protein n=1 Tax=Smallanthus sonchifolius TaxID=185202 RepID=A0ACB9BSM7_9ASTR|nr:hypothetical protein L1987_64819 [Smallanthus sonchifolius]